MIHGEAKKGNYTKEFKRHIGQVKTAHTYVIVILKRERDQDREKGQNKGIKRK